MDSKLLACPGRPHVSVRPWFKRNIRSKQLFLYKPITDQFSTVGFWQRCMNHWQSSFLWTLLIVKFLKPWRFGSRLCFCLQAKTHLTWRTPHIELFSATEPQWQSSWMEGVHQVRYFFSWSRRQLASETSCCFKH